MKQLTQMRYHRLPQGEPYFPPALFKGCYPLGPYGVPCICSYLIRHAAFERIGGFVESFNPRTHQLCEDVAFLTKVYHQVPVFVDDRCLDKYRQHPDSMSCRRTHEPREAAQAFFHRWLLKYLLQQNVRDPAIWNAVLRLTKDAWLPGSSGATSLFRLIKISYRVSYSPPQIFVFPLRLNIDIAIFTHRKYASDRRTQIYLEILSRTQ